MSSSTSSAPDSVENTPIPPELQLQERPHYHSQVASPSTTIPPSEVMPGMAAKDGIRSIPFAAISSDSNTNCTATMTTPLSLDATSLDSMSSPFLFDTTATGTMDKPVFDSDQLLHWAQPQQQKQLYSPYDNSIPHFYYSQ
ncbi:hypothetical protein BJV82DRAFT_674066 [Fennellomyces sp. T-0311]|nr:hypothetical protein BJV82DRAFT_674066 [Fennellomyces sp. T-0311]